MLIINKFFLSFGTDFKEWILSKTGRKLISKGYIKNIQKLIIQFSKRGIWVFLNTSQKQDIVPKCEEQQILNWKIKYF